MAPQSWATKEEQDFLRSNIPEYEACQVKRRYKHFWQRLGREYFVKFPAIEKCFPGLEVGQLDEGQRAELSAVIAKQQKRLKEWFRWQMNPRSRNAGYTISKKDLRTIYTGRTRMAKPYEVFAKLYSKEVEELKDRRCLTEGITGRQQLTVWHEVARELFNGATEEQLAAVEKEIEGGTEEAPETPQTYLRYLKKLPTLLDATVSPAVRKAGVLALVTIVGPDPEKGGKIMSRTFQFGDQPSTPLFSNTWSDHDTVFVEELARFARKYEFTPEICTSRSLGHATPGSASDNTEDEYAGGRVIPTLEANPDSQPSKRPSLNGVGPTTVDGPATGTALRSKTSAYRMVVLDSDEDEESNENEDNGQLGYEPMGEEEEEDCDDEDEDGKEEDDLLMEVDPHDPMKLPGEWQFSEEEWLRFEDTLESSNVTRSSLPQSRTSIPAPNQPTHQHKPIPPSQARNFSTLSSEALRGRVSNDQSGTDSRPRQNASPAHGTPAASTLRQSFIHFKALTSTPLTLSREHIASSPPSSSRLPPLPVPANAHPTASPVPQSRFGHSNAFNDAQDARPSTLQLISRSPSSSPATLSPLSSLQLPRSSNDLAPARSFPYSQSSRDPVAHPSVQLRSLFSWGRPPPDSSSTSSDEEPLSSLFDQQKPTLRRDSPENADAATTSQGSQFRVSQACDSHSSEHRSISPPLSCPSSNSLPPVVPRQHSASHPPPVLPPLSAPPLASEHLSAPSHPLATERPSVLARPLVSPCGTASTRPARSSACPTSANRVPSVAALPSAPPSSSEATTSCVVPLPSVDAAPRTVTSVGPEIHRRQGTEDRDELEGGLVPSEPARRRSTRGPVPSKRQEQLQKIGSNELQISTARLGDDVDRAWFIAALENLATYDLGSPWLDVVKKWETHERLMGQGNIGKGSLPLRGRPEEWTKWTAKSWRGARAYDKVPSVDDPADIGVAVVKWWGLMQPSFRIPDKGLPPPIYSNPDADGDPWGSLRKSGPNGFISLLMLMAWWGHAATTQRSEWQDDTLPLWDGLLADVHHVLDEMIKTFDQSPSTSLGKHGREKENSTVSGSSKRKCRR